MMNETNRTWENDLNHVWLFNVAINKWNAFYFLCSALNILNSFINFHYLLYYYFTISTIRLVFYLLLILLLATFVSQFLWFFIIILWWLYLLSLITYLISYWFWWRNFEVFALKFRRTVIILRLIRKFTSYPDICGAFCLLNQFTW